eukprot:scaffold529_cov308-Pinguiococcus_pyrenoidosus.AAC.77
MKCEKPVVSCDFLDFGSFARLMCPMACQRCGAGVVSSQHPSQGDHDDSTRVCSTQRRSADGRIRSADRISEELLLERRDDHMSRASRLLALAW